MKCPSSPLFSKLSILLTALLLAPSLPLLPVPPALAATAGNTQSENILTEITAQDLMSLMQAEGYTVSIDKDGDISWKVDGYNTSVILYKGTSIQFYSAFSNDDDNVSLEAVNAWNRDKRYSKTYLDEKGSPCLELDLDFEGGVTRSRLINFLTVSKLSFELWVRDVIHASS